MTFNLQTWREQFHGRLPGWRQRFSGAGVSSLYAALCAAALWPVVAATRAGDWGAMAALGGVVAGVGGNLVANIIQNWRDEADGAQQLAARVQDPALQKELDEILAKLEAVTAVHDALPAADRVWFVTTLQRELEQLGNASRYEAILKGSGALAQGDHAVAVGERGVHVGGNVQGPIITGDGHTIVTGGAVAALPPALAPLRNSLSRYFDNNELSGLCFDMGIPFDDLPGQTRTEKAQALIALCYRDDRLPQLLTLCRQYRPHGDWTYPGA